MRLDEVKHIRDQAEAIRHYAKSVAQSLEIQNKAAEIRLRAERKAGSILASLHLRGAKRRVNSDAEISQIESLEKLGIDRNQSHRWQQVAGVPDDVFKGYVQKCKEEQQEITDAGLLRCAKAHSSTERERRIEPNSVQFPGLSQSVMELVAHGTRFSCICIYPPWPSVRGCGRAPNQRDHRRQFIMELAKLPIADVMADNSHLHLWSTSERLWDAMRLCSVWGFTYRSILVCGRPPRERGSYWRDDQEFLVAAAKGNLEFRNNNVSSFLDLGTTMSNGHLQSIRRLIEQVSLPPFLELFGRGKESGWTIIPG